MGPSLALLLLRGEGEEEGGGSEEEGVMSSDTWETRRMKEGKIPWGGMIEDEWVMTKKIEIGRYE